MTADRDRRARPHALEPSTIPASTSSSSTSSEPSQIVVVDPRQLDEVAAARSPCLMPARTASTSILRPADCSAPAMPASWSRSTRAPAACSRNEKLSSGVPDVVWFNRQAPAPLRRGRRSRRGRRVRHGDDAQTRHRRDRDGAPIPRPCRRPATVAIVFLPRTHRAAHLSGSESSTWPTSPCYGFPIEHLRQRRPAGADRQGVPFEFRDLEGEMARAEPAWRCIPSGACRSSIMAASRLYETAAIALYVDEAFTGPALQPTTAQARARMHQWISSLNGYYYPNIAFHLGHERLIYPAARHCIRREGASPSHCRRSRPAGRHGARAGRGPRLPGRRSPHACRLLHAAHAHDARPDAGRTGDARVQGQHRRLAPAPRGAAQRRRRCAPW